MFFIKCKNYDLNLVVQLLLYYMHMPLKVITFNIKLLTIKLYEHTVHVIMPSVNE